MIDEKATFEKFGYYSKDLTQKSGKKIVAVCDGCGKIRIYPKIRYSKICCKCSYARRKMTLKIKYFYFLL